MRTYFDALNVERGCSTADVVKSYRRIAKVMHPDVAPERETEFKLVSAAFQALKTSDDAIWAYARRVRLHFLSRPEQAWSREYTVLIDGYCDESEFVDRFEDLLRKARARDNAHPRQPHGAKVGACGHPTKSGPCCRPAGHTPNGHMSQKVSDTKAANQRARKAAQS